MRSGGPGYYPGINALRGLAALLVVVQHAGFFAAQTAGARYSDVVKIDFGTIGVVMFFAISGFVIGLNRHLPTAEFAARRALRIYPAFWAAYALSAAIALSAGKETGFSWPAALLLPSRGYPVVHLPFWTLVFEVFFYALAAAMFSLRLSDRTLTALALCWILVIQTMNPYMTGSIAFLPGALIPFAPYNLFFALGLICALNLDFFSRASINQLLGVAVAATAVLPILPALPHISALLTLGVGLSALLVALTQVERWPRIALMLGDASYGVFLLHYAAILAAATWLAGTALSAFALWPILFLAGVIVGVPFGLAEFSFHRTALRSLLSRFRTRSAAVPGTVEPRSGA
jgi:exopolysaccharide production protein ExoZ